MWSKKRRLIIAMVGVLVGLAAAACGSAAPPSPSLVGTTDPTPNFNPAASREAATPTPVLAQPTATAAPKPSIDTNVTEPNSTDFPSTEGPTRDASGVERPSAPVPQMEGESAQQAPTLHPKEKPPAAEPLDPPAEAPLTSLDSTRKVEVDFRRFRQLIPRDAINPIYRPRFIPAESAALNPAELVIGVAINGESKAYPVGPLNRREMVNDVVGGVPILVTW